MNAERLAEIRELVVGWSPVSEAMRELLDHIAQLEAQRGGAVVVADPDREKLSGMSWSDKNCYLDGYCDAMTRAKVVDASQVLQPGMVGVDREELMYLRALERYARKHGPDSIQDVVGTLDHLRRAQQVEGE